MLNIRRLDQAAASRSKYRHFDRLLTVTAPHERIVLAVIALIMLALLAWTLFGNIKQVVMIDGVLIKPGPRHDVTAAEPGHLLELLAVPGDRVEAGDPIARQSVPNLEREIAALRGRVELLERGAMEAETDATSLSSILQSARVALLELEARRSAQELIVTHSSGEIMTLPYAPGEFLPLGAVVAWIRGIPHPDAGPVQAVLRVVPSMAQRIRPGMQALVEVAMPHGSVQTLEGEVVSVTAEPLPQWLAELQPSTRDSSHRIDVMVHQTPERPVPNGAACRVKIVLGEGTPIVLLDPEPF